MDFQTGTVLWELKATERRYPASLTKVMTAVLVIEKGNLDRLVKISDRAARTGETGIGLQTGETLTVRQLLSACLIKSANDAAVALAEATSGSVKAFVKAMNAKAASLGCTGTHFANPTGLHAENHYTTAADLALITRYACSLPLFTQLVKRRTATIPCPAKKTVRRLRNRNRLLFRWNLCDGVKTGYTRQAGNCLLATATKSGWKLLAVVLHSKTGQVWADAQRILEHGFAHYERLEPVVHGAAVGPPLAVSRSHGVCRPVAQRTVLCVVPRGHPVVSRPIYRPLVAPVVRGANVGRVVFRCDGQTVGQTDLVAEQSVPLSFGWRVRPYLWRLLVVALVLLGARLLYGTVAKSDRRRWSHQPPKRGGLHHLGPRPGEWNRRDQAGYEGGPEDRRD